MKGYARRVQRVLMVALALNLAVAVGKLAAGAWANSLAVIADGIHSGVDALANAAALLVLRLAAQPADEDHPYGHSKYETLAAFVLSGVLLLTSFEVARAAFGRILSPQDADVTGVTLAVMAATLGVNVFVAWWETRKGREYGSELLVADAAQTRGDVLVSGAVLGGLFLELAGVPLVDAVLALGVAGFIAYASYQVFRDVLPVLTDRIVYDPVDVARIVRGVDGVRNVHDIRSRGTPREAYVQMHLVVDKEDVAGAHAIADEVERRLADELGVKEAFVHIEPEDDASGPPGTHADASVLSGSRRRPALGKG